MRARHLGPVRKWSFSVLGLTLAFLAAPDDAQARHHHTTFRRTGHSGHRLVHRGSLVDSPGFSAMVVDAGSGRTLYAVNEDALRHPASLTKVMTLYLLFEKLDAGEIRLDSRIGVSAHAASQAPTKLGLRPGSTIAVEDAIKAIVTKSANDMAVAVAEAIGGDEPSFAGLMTRKAHALGMARTTYVNASGLPDDRQLTTARDLTLLGRSIRERFPDYYHYFSTPSFTYAGSFMPNHNHLMSRVEGMDGIKTGYTRASGFNLLSSVNRGSHHIVSVVMGGHTAASRDTIMAGLIEDHIEEAAPTRLADARPPSPIEEAAPTPATEAPQQRPQERVESDEDSVADADGGPSLIAPTMAVPPRPAERVHAVREVARAVPVPVEHARPAFIAGALRGEPERPSTPAEPDRRRLAQDGSTGPRSTKAGTTTIALATATPSTLHTPARTPMLVASTAPIPVARPDITSRSRAEDARAEEARSEATGTRGAAPAGHGWIIQIGATDAADKATDLLNRAKSEGRSALASARPFTEKVKKGEATLYRARFAGLDTGEAAEACKTLKRSGFACFAQKD